MKRWPLLLLGGAVVLAAMVIATRRAFSHETVVNELASARPTRALAARVSIPVRYRECTVTRAKYGQTVPREACGADDGRLAEFDALADAGQSTDPDSLQASALLAMMGADSTEEAADTAISRLSRALRLSTRRVPILVDLSGAHIARAERSQNSRDLVQGLDYALQALGSDSGNASALFNAALALGLLGLDEVGTLAWTDFLRVDSTSDWADEARRRRKGLQHPPPPRVPEAKSSEAEVRAFATDHPQEARLLGWDTVLGKWGEAWEAGKTAEAAELLQLAERLGATLAWHGRDASLDEAVGAIRAAADDSAAMRVLAREHRRYAAGQAVFLEHDTTARDTFASVVGARPRSPMLVRWAKASHAGALVYAGHHEQAESEIVALLPGIDSVRYPALAARARWILGTARIKHQNWAGARPPYLASARLFERAGEPAFAAATRPMAGEAAHSQGDTVTAYREMQRGLMTLRASRSSVQLHYALVVLAHLAATDGMPLAAARVQNEDVTIARRQIPLTTVEALVEAAYIHVITGRPREAARYLDWAGARLDTMKPNPAREKLEARVSALSALVATDSASLAGLDSAVALFIETDEVLLLVPALLQRAEVRLTRREVEAAAADLDRATARIREASQAQGYASLRAAVMERARIHFDRLVMLHVHAGDTVAALRTLERGRVSFAPGSTTVPAPGRLMAPPGEVAVEYALIGDTLLTWIVRGNGIRLLQDTVNRGDFLRRIEQVNAALESPAPAESARPNLRRLYELLVRPVRERLGARDTTLLILADGEVGGVPFHVLVDSARRDRYMVEDYTLRFAPSLADAARLAPTANEPARPALLVANPEFDPHFNPMLDELDGAQAEVDSLARLYPRDGGHAGYVRISGKDATRDALIHLAPRAGIIHYAGHALFDDARPERSALVLAGADTTGRLTAEAVNALQLRGVRLVVLSACSTVRSREGRSGGFSGLSGALLGAGAGGVVGSLWQVDDSLTTPFMLAFHRAYRETGDPAVALRDAQLKMLRLRDPRLSSPAVWGGFRYIGH